MTNLLSTKIQNRVREVVDFPSEGINFKDITPILEDPELCGEIVKSLKDSLKDTIIDAVVGIESRGFLFGMLLASELNVPFVVVRKKGKLPWKTNSFKYDLEYGTAEVEMHLDSIKPDWKVLVHDDLLATGGTAVAASELVQMQGGQVAGFAFLIEIVDLKGRKVLEKYSKNIINLIRY